MCHLVDAFRNKVQQCLDNYNPDLTVKCLRIVTSISAIKPLKPKTVPSKLQQTNATSKEDTFSIDPFADLDIEEALTRELPNFTISRLRTTVQNILRRATLRQDGSLYFAGASTNAMATKSVQYFIWYFDFMDYLQELHTNFVEKIFTPLFKYFHDFNRLGSTGRTTTMSSTFSKLSQFSNNLDLGLSDGEHECVDDLDSGMDYERLRNQARLALQSLKNEYKDLKVIYDTSETDKVAQRLSFLKDQIDLLLDEEDEVDPDLYSWDSAKMIQHLNLDFGTENFIRLMPDILVKLRKAAWLAYRWLELDDQRAKDVDEKLNKIVTIEKQLSSRLNNLKEIISKGQQKLELETNELSHLMEREARSDTLNMKTYSLSERTEHLEKEIKDLLKERDTFAPKLDAIVKNKDLRAYHKLKFKFESNKLQRLVLDRKLQSLYYQRNLLQDDINIELFIRPSVIHSTNRAQDECERLEKLLREQKEEAITIEHALIPVQEDKVMLMNRSSRQLQEKSPWEPIGTDNPLLNLDSGTSCKAVYIRSSYKKPSSRTNSDYPQRNSNSNSRIHELNKLNIVNKTTINRLADTMGTCEDKTRTLLDSNRNESKLNSDNTRMEKTTVTSFNTFNTLNPYTIYPRHFLVRPMPAGNNRVLRGHSPPVW